MYRAHQLLNKHFSEEATQILCIIICTDCALIIVALFALIGYHIQLAEAFIAAAGSTGVIAIIITAVCMELSSSMVGLSQEVPSSFLRRDLNLGKYHRMKLKASANLGIRIGPFTQITKHTFPTLMSEVIAQRVLDLLIVFHY